MSFESERYQVSCFVIFICGMLIVIFFVVLFFLFVDGRFGVTVLTSLKSRRMNPVKGNQEP